MGGVRVGGVRVGGVPERAGGLMKSEFCNAKIKNNWGRLRPVSLLFAESRGKRIEANELIVQILKKEVWLH